MCDPLSIAEFSSEHDMNPTRGEGTIKTDSRISLRTPWITNVQAFQSFVWSNLCRYPRLTRSYGTISSGFSGVGGVFSLHIDLPGSSPHLIDLSWCLMHGFYFKLPRFFVLFGVHFSLSSEAPITIFGNWASCCRIIVECVYVTYLSTRLLCGRESPDENHFVCVENCVYSLCSEKTCYQRYIDHHRILQSVLWTIGMYNWMIYSLKTHQNWRIHKTASVQVIALELSFEFFAMNFCQLPFPDLDDKKDRCLCVNASCSSMMRIQCASFLYCPWCLKILKLLITTDCDIH